MQLAHYRRMLQACGRATESGLAAIIGKEGLVTWVDLEAETLRAFWKPHSPKSAQPVMERYDHEFAFRLDALAARGFGDTIVEGVNSA